MFVWLFLIRNGGVYQKKKCFYPFWILMYYDLMVLTIAIFIFLPKEKQKVNQNNTLETTGSVIIPITLMMYRSL